MAKEKTLGRRMADRLKQFAEELEQAGDIPERFTCRTVRLNLEPAEYDAQLVKKTRGLLNASQAIFAQFIGVSVKAVQEWEQGVKTPRGGACRLMDEIRQDPEYWRTRILDCVEPKEAVYALQAIERPLSRSPEPTSWGYSLGRKHCLYIRALSSMSQRSYYYVGPAEIRHTARSQPQGVVIRSEEDLERWLATDPTDRSPAGNPIATFTIGSDKILRLAPRRSEHVACAGGEPVLSAGEITFDREGSVVEVTNQSTGYCPEPESWPVVAAVLSDVGVAHPGGFTTEIVFRLCPACHEPNVVKDSWFECQLCGAELPESWNVEQRCRDE